jgi:hypothetical protein
MGIQGPNGGIIHGAPKFIFMQDQLSLPEGRITWRVGVHIGVHSFVIACTQVLFYTFC